MNKYLAQINKSPDLGKATKGASPKGVGQAPASVSVLPHQLAYRPNMTQSELSNLIMKQCSRYGEPSTLRALVPFLLTAAPEAVPFVEAAAEVRDEFYRANGIRPWRRQN